MGERVLQAEPDAEIGLYPTTMEAHAHPMMPRTRAQGFPAYENLAAYETLACGVVVQGADATLLYANTAALAMLGLPAGYFQGTIRTSDRWPIVRQDGSPFPCHDWPAMVAARTGQPQRGVLMGITPPGRAQFWILVNAAPIARDDGTILRVVVSFVDVTAHVAERQRFDRLAALQRLTARLAAATTPDEAAHATLDEIGAMPGILGGIVRLLSDDGAFLDLIDATGLVAEREDFQARQSLAAHRSYCAAVRDRRPVWLSSEEEARTRFPMVDIPWQAVPGVRSIAILPLLVDERPIGVLSVCFHTARTFDPADRAFLETLAQVAAQALARTRLSAVEREKARQAETLQRITAALSAARTPNEVAAAVDHGCTMLQATGGRLRLLSADGARLTFVEPTFATSSTDGAATIAVADAHPISDVARMGEPVWIESPRVWAAQYPVSARRAEQDGIQAIACVPLFSGDRLIGVLAIGFATPRVLDATARQLFVVLAHLAAQALERARRFREEQERADQAEAMAEIGAALAGTLDADQLYQVVLDQVVRLLPCDHAGVMLYRDGWVTLAAARGAPSPPIGTRMFRTSGPDKPWLPTDHEGLVYLPDAAEAPGWIDIDPWLGEQRIRGMIAVPLIIHGEVVGSFAVHSRTPHFYTERHLALAAAFGERVAQAVRNARLYAAERERAHLAERLARMRSELMADVSHEMRTPLNAVLGYAELLRGHWAHYTDEQRRERLGKILGAVERQRRLLQDLVLLNRIEGGDVVPLRPEPVAINSLARQAAEEVRLSYHGQRILVRGSEAVRVHADSMRLLQVLVNLLDNGAKYSPEGSPVRIGWRSEGAMVVIRVRDRGPGISDADRERLFVPFGRARGSRPRTGHGSTGLGLSLSRRLAESMSGSLDLESSGPDGSTFAVRLPGCIPPV